MRFLRTTPRTKSAAAGLRRLYSFVLSALVALLLFSAVGQACAVDPIMVVYQEKDGRIFGVDTRLDIFNNPELGGRKLLAPGDSGTYVFRVANESKKAKLPYTLQLSAANAGRLPIVISLEKNGDYVFGAAGLQGMLPLSQFLLEDNTLAAKASDTYTLHWAWRSISNENDTDMGNDGTQTYTLWIRAVGTLDEDPNPPKPPGPKPPGPSKPGTTKPSVPPAGDSTSAGTFIASALLSTALLAGALVIKRRNLLER